MDMKRTFAALTLAASLAIPSVSNALTITSIGGVWEDASPSVSGEGTSQIRWGVSAGHGRSGYDFNATSTALNVGAGEAFVLGTFDHHNMPVYGRFLDYVDLAVNFRIEGLGNAISSRFSFEHLETLNGSRNCPNGARRGVGVNVNGCADRVGATLNLGQSEFFEIDGVSYVMDSLGFQYEGSLLTDFWTIEREINSAELVAIFRELPGEEEQPPSEVPLPASGLLLLAGVAGLFMKRRAS